MVDEVCKGTAKMILKLEKYQDGVSKQDIESGLAVPYEVIISEEDLSGEELQTILRGGK